MVSLPVVGGEEDVLPEEERANEAAVEPLEETRSELSVADHYTLRVDLHQGH